MSNRTKSIGPEVQSEFSRSHLLRSLGPVVYAIRLDDGTIKIGFTTDLEDRERTVRRQGASATSEILAFLPGTLEEEQAIHASLTPHRARGLEYYHPTSAVLEAVNQMRTSLGLDPLAA
jgi:hypothetical protein